jgi:hypothetical protein
MPSFDFHVSKIEDGIQALLTARYLKAPGNPDGYLKAIAAYGGDLDEKVLREFVTQQTTKFPLALISYGDGEDQLQPATSTALGQPRTFRHLCTFSIIHCSNDARGEKQQRAGVYQMLSGTREALSGVVLVWRPGETEGSGQIVSRVPNQRKAVDDVLLNVEPLRPTGVQYLARLQDMTAYAQHFDTYFDWTEPDRRAAGVPVEDLILDVTPLNGSSEPGELPGVEIE